MLFWIIASGLYTNVTTGAAPPNLEGEFWQPNTRRLLSIGQVHKLPELLKNLLTTCSFHGNFLLS